MQRSEFSRKLAHAIADVEWSRPAIEASLIARLPESARRQAPRLAEYVFRQIRSRYGPPPLTLARVLESAPAFQPVYSRCLKSGAWPEFFLEEPRMQPVGPFSLLDVPQLPTLRALAAFLEILPDRLEYLADCHGRAEAADEMQINHYFYHISPKKSGGHRLIEAPKQTLKAIQRQILRSILDKVPPHPDAFGFVSGRSCLQAAARHSGEQVVLSFDLADFFSSVSAARVHALFRCLGYPHMVARMLTGLTSVVTPHRVLGRLPVEVRSTLKSPHLPQGAPTSPSLANAAAFRLDRRLAGLARRIGANYSRYADDMTFSGDKEIVPVLMGLVPSIISDEGFRLNGAKTRVMPQSRRQCVTGLVVNRHLNIARGEFDRLKAKLHSCGKPEDARLKDAVFRAQILGKIDWINSVNPVRGNKLRQLLERAVDIG